MSSDVFADVFIVGAVLGVAALGLTSVTLHVKMIEAVNRKLSSTEQFGAAWWDPAKTARLLREYRRLYPGDLLVHAQLTVVAIIMACFISAALWLLRR